MRKNDSDYTILQECLLLKRVLPQKGGGPGQKPLAEALTMRMVGNSMERVFGGSYRVFGIIYRIIEILGEKNRCLGYQ